MSLMHRLFKIIRTAHLYLGVFSAPMLLFFAITGGLQTFSLHETTRGSSYTPPAWLATAAQLHKKQTIVLPQRRLPAVKPVATGNAKAASAASSDSGRPVSTQLKKNLWPMKIFFGVIALSLLISTLSGLYMAWRYSRQPYLVAGLFGAGLLVPLLLSLV